MIHMLYEKGVDSRQLAFLKQGFVKADRESKGRMKLWDFKEVMAAILKSQKKEKEVFEGIIEFIKDD